MNSWVEKVLNRVHSDIGRTTIRFILSRWSCSASGVVEPYTAEVYLQGSVVVNEDGSFTSAVAFQKDYAVVDVTVPEEDLRERIPVFAGNDPSMLTGGLAGRLLPNGMDALGNLGAQIDATGWLMESVINYQPTTAGFHTNRSQTPQKLHLTQCVLVLGLILC